MLRFTFLFFCILLFQIAGVVAQNNYLYFNDFSKSYGSVDGINCYYFKDKNGEKVDKLGTWAKAEDFDSNRFAKVTNSKGIDYLIDTLGNTYKVAYTLEDLDPTITALDLSDSKLETMPEVIFKYKNLKVLLLP